MTMKPKDMIKLLEKNGFVRKSQNGSHVKLYNEITKVYIIVPVHSKELKKGLEIALLKQAGLT